jgi:predicted SpoU family rRNA methylase
LTADGGFVVVGGTESYGAGSSDFYVLKFDGKGKFLWDKIYGEVNEDVLHGVVANKDGSFVVTGKTKSFKSKHSDIDIIKYSKDGKEIWHKIFGFKSKEWANDIIKVNGGYLLAGTTKSFGFGKFDFYLLEIDEKGSSIWANVYGGEFKEMANALTRTADGKVVVVGETESFGKGDFDFFMIELQKR